MIGMIFSLMMVPAADVPSSMAMTCVGLFGSKSEVKCNSRRGSLNFNLPPSAQDHVAVVHHHVHLGVLIGMVEGVLDPVAEAPWR